MRLQDKYCKEIDKNDPKNAKKTALDDKTYALCEFLQNISDILEAKL